jgi:hypothetical protein
VGHHFEARRLVEIFPVYSRLVLAAAFTTKTALSNFPDLTAFAKLCVGIGPGASDAAVDSLRGLNCRDLMSKSSFSAISFLRRSQSKSNSILRLVSALKSD